MFFFEEHYRLLGFKAIGGVDEVGRGPLAGPVVAACCILQEGVDLPEGVDDSKKLSRKKRRLIYDQLKEKEGIDWALGIVDATKIDEINILQASHLAMRKAVSKMTKTPDFLLIDGLPVPGFEQKTRSLVKGDSRSMSIAAASILAKEFRDDLMIEAAKKAEAHEFILQLRDINGRSGYDAHVGERGVSLSGGQRQRIAIARVILKNAPILIMDEATSALDSEIESAIQKSLYQLMEAKTVIAIAHRLSTIAAMDRLIVLDQGEIIEQGTHQQLMEAQGVYAQLWHHQSGGFLGVE